MSENPYAPPQARVADPLTDRGFDLPRIASGQKLVIYGVLLYLVGSFGIAIVPFSFVLVIPAVLLGFIGIFRISGGFHWPVGGRIGLLVALLVPLLGLITLLIVNRKANKALRAGGYRVGFLGASK